jgi:alkanesulfonate monooxygenase SsuD/methylene tetrahydromethanopterin reductase-like flavin-dependent oxidoreductase (luciferase family)
MRLGVVFDLRNPLRRRQPWSELYGAALEFVEEADRLGLDIAAGEHHFWDDGYVPQPLTFLAAAAARTSSARLLTSVLIAPLQHPVALAEQAAMIDCVSGGRLELGLGTGYRVPEFDAFGVDLARRLRLYEEHVATIRTLWADGKVTPPPVQQTIPLWAGVRGPKGSHLAGRLGMGLLTLPGTQWEAYLAGIRDGGGSVAPRFGGPVYAMLADDPERAFAELAPRIEEHWHAYDRYAVEGTGTPVPEPLGADDYRRIGPFAGPVDASGGRTTIGFGVFTPEGAADAVRAVAGGRVPYRVYFPATLGSGFDELARRHLELIATRLRPLLADDPSVSNDHSVDKVEHAV